MIKPKPAAACIIMRENGEILLGQRSRSMRFMGGHHVFPGGRIDEDESASHVVGGRDTAHARALHAVAREVFEETGLMAVRGELPETETLEGLRSELLEGTITFDAVLSRHGLAIHAEDFESAGNWITPPMSPIRFDTQYFLYRHSSGQEPVLREGEMTRLDWIAPNEARKRWHLGEMEIPTPVAHTLRTIGAVPYPDFLGYLRNAADRRNDFANRFEVHRGVQVMPLKTRTIPPATHTNCVLIGERDVFVIDPGAEDAGELAFLKEQLDHMIELGGSIAAVILTHSHMDHVDGAEYVRDQYEVPIWAHAAAAKQLDFHVDKHIEDGERIVSAGDPDWVLRAVFTPGHDPGHLCFVEESTGTLIAGDMIANPGTIVVSLEFGGDMTDFIDSLDTLIAIDCALVIPGHGTPLGNPKEKLTEHRDHRLWREQKIKDALDAGHTELNGLLSKAYDDVPDVALPLAEHALRAHLARLGVSLSD